MLGWLRRRRAHKSARVELVASDARDLLARHGERAYYVARDRDRAMRKGSVIDANRSKGHWRLVALEIARMVGKDVGLNTASRYLDVAAVKHADKEETRESLR